MSELLLIFLAALLGGMLSFPAAFGCFWLYDRVSRWDEIKEARARIRAREARP